MNISAGWFAVAVIEPNFGRGISFEAMGPLTLRLTAGIVSLMLAKVFRERARI